MLAASRLLALCLAGVGASSLFSGTDDALVLVQRQAQKVYAPACRNLARSVKPHGMETAFDQDEFEREYSANDYASQIYGRSSLPHDELFRVPLHFAESWAFSQRLVLHHIWKTGGTHLCELAEESGAKVPHNSGCHRFTDDSTPVSYQNYNGSTTWRACAIDSTLSGIPFDVVGHECAIDSNLIQQAKAAGFAVVGVVRDPVEQAFSWFAHAHRAGRPFDQYSTFPEWINGCGCSQQNPKCGFFTFLPNLQTRFLAGGACNDNPEEDGCVEKALANLEEMIVVLEQRGNHLLGTEKLASVGWTINEKATDYTSGAVSLMDGALAGDIALVRQMQRVDIELIEKAKAKGLLRLPEGSA